jgi:hypothetical protein
MGIAFLQPRRMIRKSEIIARPQGIGKLADAIAALNTDF